jgi:hypothetical protein
VATYNVKISAGGLGVEDVATLVFNFFKTAESAPFAAAIPILIFN